MTLTTQFLTMIAMIGMGSLFGAMLDTYNRFLQRQRRKTWIVFINDLLFWILQGLSIFYVLFLVNEGEVRIYIFLALLCGFAAYQSLIKRLYLKCLEWMISFVISTYKLIVKIVIVLIIKPVRSLLLTILSLLIIFGKGLLTILKALLLTLWWVLKVVWKPIKWLLLILWRLLPKRVKNTVEKLYNKMAGFNDKIQKYTTKFINKLKSIKNNKK
ncbi:spore cortex biosynthesis protein YabQ [Bacillus sp. B15-48]|uniref:spore cortex biosynthesis protein YabQ n=1 Tax=Bacillus sp. B15-48 TaxID=1548601 RepID=UPI00193FEDDC|nr:spore cortex biosynthesis protein YabQ [Bacillus sp. B15-48]MBM4765303.1 spore cortex biosynthesis protein YabQ [Bacillus sp. B15-48]